MSIYIMGIGSTSHKTVPGCTKCICGYFNSVRKAYAYAMGQSVEFVMNLDIVYDYFQNKAFTSIREKIEAELLLVEEAGKLYDGVLGTALNDCRKDAFVHLYKFVTPIDYNTVQGSIEIYKDTFLEDMLRTGSVVPVEI